MTRVRNFHDATLDAFALKNGRVALRIEGVNVSTKAELNSGVDWLFEFGVLTIDSVTILSENGVAQTLEDRIYGQLHAGILRLELAPDSVEMKVEWHTHPTDGRLKEYAEYTIGGQTRWIPDGPPLTGDEWEKTQEP